MSINTHASSKVVKDVDNDDVVRDVMMWKRSNLSGTIFVGVTTLWVLLQVYHFKFLTIASWLSIAFVSLLFLYGSFQRLLGREVPKMEEWEIREERGNNIAIGAKQMIEKSIKWIFYVSCESEWYIFVGVISSLLLLAYLAHHFHLLTLLYAGTVMGMTMPYIYKKREREMKAFGEKIRKQSSRIYEYDYKKAFSKFKPKQKKME